MTRRALLPLAGLAVLLAGCAGPEPAPPPPPPPVVALLTDFGLSDDAVGLMRGAVLSVCPEATVADLSHGVARFDVAEGARLLADAPAFYPPGTIFCVVVDPGVGTARRGIVARLADGTLVVAPDNGVISAVVERHGPAEVRAITDPTFQRQEVSATFHGRDVFAPAAGHLAAGRDFAEVGPLVEDWVHIEQRLARREGTAIVGEVIAIDEPFGNVWTNVPPTWLEQLGLAEGDGVRVELGAGEALEVPWVSAFGDVADHAPLIYVNSRGRMGLALNMADFARAHGVERGDEVRLTRP